MAKYIVAWDLPPEHRNEAIGRFMEGSAMQTPDGLAVLGRWHAVGGVVGWCVVETDDPKIMADWLVLWIDLFTYDITPVLDDEELGELYQKHGIG